MQIDKNNLIPDICIVSKSPKLRRPFVLTPSMSSIEAKVCGVWQRFSVAVSYCCSVFTPYNSTVKFEANLSTFLFFFFFLSASVVAAGCNGREGGRAGGEAA